MSLKHFSKCDDPNELEFNGNFQFNIFFLDTTPNSLKFILKGNSSINPKLKEGTEWILDLQNEVRSVDTLIHWAYQSSTDLNFLKCVLDDLIAMVEEWEVIKTYNCDINMLYIAILFFKKNKHMHPDFNEINNNIVYKFYQMSTEKNIHKFKAVEYNLASCFDDENQAWFDHKGIKREERVFEIVKRLYNYKFNSDKDEFFKKKKLLENSTSWFLSRYDLNNACDIIIHNYDLQYFVKPIFLYLPEIISFFVLAFTSIFFFNTLDTNEYFYCLATISLLTLVLYLLLLATPFLFRSVEYLGIFLPRWVGGIIAGYILLLMSGEMWRFICQFTEIKSSLTQLVLPLVPLAWIYIYIFIKISHVKGICDAPKKALLFFLKVYSYAIFIGLVISDIFGDAMMKNLEDKIYIPGVFGHIYPHMLICLAPLALFVGIILQLLWDDKKLTDKI